MPLASPPTSRPWRPCPRCSQSPAARETSLSSLAPRLAHDLELRRWWGRAVRLVSSHELLVRHMQWAAARDYAAVLPSVRGPTLVMHRRENRIWDVETSRAA